MTRVSPNIRCPILRKACVYPSLYISSLGVTRVSPSISFPIVCPSSHVCCWGCVCTCTCWQKLVWVTSVATFDHGTHMQAHPGPVRHVGSHTQQHDLIWQIAGTALWRWPFISISMSGGRCWHSWRLHGVGSVGDCTPVLAVLAIA